MLADGAALPDGGAILVSAERFLGDPEALFARAGKVGVIWPNNRDIDDLVPYLDRLGSVALVFPTFAMAAPIARRGCCASAISIAANCARRGRCCATSSCSCCAPASTPSR